LYRDVSVVLPTTGRPELSRAVRSLLEQTATNVQVLVVIDGGTSLPAIPRSSSVSVITNRGPGTASAARNSGIAAADADLVTFLDDDDWVTSEHVASTLERMKDASPSDCWVTGVTGMGADHTERYERVPPDLSPRGRHWSLSTEMSWAQSLTKLTLFAPKVALEEVNGFDESFRTREWTELFWRLNAIVNIRGSDQVTYRRTVWDASLSKSHLGGLRENRAMDFRRLIKKHHRLLRQHKPGFTRTLREHARRCRSDGLTLESGRTRLRLEALRFNPNDYQCMMCKPA